MDIEEATFYNGVYIKDCADSPYDIDLLRGRLTEAAYGGRSTNVTNWKKSRIAGVDFP